MAAKHREAAAQWSAPIVAWLIDQGYVVDDCGILDVSPEGRRYIRDGLLQAHRSTRKDDSQAAL